MSNDIRKILESLAQLEQALTPVSVKKGLNPQQRSVPQLPAEFKPKTIRALGADTDPEHPMHGLAVGAAESAGSNLEERCWDGYRQSGMKNKGGRQVPNCVPAESKNPVPKTRNPVAKNSPTTGSGAHKNRKKAQQQGDVKHKKPADRDYELSEMQHSPGHALMILNRVPEGYRGARLYDKVMNVIIKRMGPVGSDPARRELYQTLAADVMEKYIKKYNTAQVTEDQEESIFNRYVLPALERVLGQDSAFDRLNQRAEDAIGRYVIPALERAMGEGSTFDELNQKAEDLVGKYVIPFLRKIMGEDPEQGVSEGGPFSYGAKKPRRDSLRDQMAKQSKKYRDQQPVIEPRDQMVGVAKVVKKDVSEGSGQVDQAQVVADKLTTDKNLSKLSAMAHDSTIYRALDRYFEKHGYPETIYNRVAATVFKKLRDSGRRLSTEPKIQEQGVSEGVFDLSPAEKIKVQYLAHKMSAFPEYWNHKSQTFTDKGWAEMHRALGGSKEHMAYAKKTYGYGPIKEQGVSEGSNSLPSYLRGESRFVKSAYKTLIKYGFIPDNEDERTSQMGSFKHAKGHMADITWEGNIKLLIKQPNGKYMRLYLDDATEMPKVAAQLQLSPVSTEQGVSEGLGSDMIATWRVTLDDGTTVKITTGFDEIDRDYAESTLKLQHPKLAGKNIEKIKLLDYRVDTGSGYAPARPRDHRPTEPFGRDVDNPMVREQSLAEAIAEIEEDMLSKVRRDLTQYLDRLEKKAKQERGLSKKEQPVDEDPTAVDTMSAPPPAPIQDPVMPESVPVKTIAMEDGCVLEIHGDQSRGFEVRRGGRSMATRFPNIDHAQMAVDLYRSRRGKNNDSADYVDER